MNKLHQLLPRHLTRFNMRMSDASSAVESAVKQARRATRRPKVLTCAGIYLGQNMQTIHMRGSIPKPMDLLIGGHEDVIFAPTSFDPVTGTRIPLEVATEEAVSLVAKHASALACVLLDPILISCGALMTSDFAQYLRAVQAACRAHDVPFALDESQTFGWVPQHTLSAEMALPRTSWCSARELAGFSCCPFARRPRPSTTWRSARRTIPTAGTCSPWPRSRRHATSWRARRRPFQLLREHIISCLARLVAGRSQFLSYRGNGLVFAVQMKLAGAPDDVRMFARRISDRCLEPWRVHSELLELSRHQATASDHERRSLRGILDPDGGHRSSH